MIAATAYDVAAAFLAGLALGLVTYYAAVKGRLELLDEIERRARRPRAHR